MTIAGILTLGVLVLAYMASFVFGFLFKRIQREKYSIVKTITMSNEGFREVKHLDDSNKEEIILKKAENDIKQYIINKENIADTNVNVLASAVVETHCMERYNEYILNVIVYIQSVDGQNKHYSKYGIKYTEDIDINDDNTETSKRCRGCGSEMQGNKCKYCGLTETEKEVELTTVEIYNIN